MTATTTPAPARAASTTRGTGTLAGTGTLIRFMLRRDRIRLPVWIAAITFLTWSSAASLPGVYPDAASRQARAELMSNPGAVAVSGPGYGLDDYTFGAMIANELLSWTAIFVALMSLLLTARHTRAEEETGRAELVRAAVVGRHAQTTAALVVVGGANLALGALLALSLGPTDAEGLTWVGSWTLGAALASVGLVFTALTAVTAQIGESARATGGLAGAAFAFVYLLRAAGDMSAVDQPGGGVLSWLSPIGWAQATRAYVDERWWPLLLPVALAALLVVTAFVLSARRDLGAGMLQARAGNATAPPRLAGTVGLAWRQHRTSLMWWAIALGLFGLGYGTIVSEVESFVQENPALDEWIATVGGASVVDAFLGVIVSLWAIAVAVFAVLAVLRLRSEESAGRAEPVLATAVSRTRWAAGHLAVALVGGVVLLAVSGAGLGLTVSSALGDWSRLPEIVGAALAYAPAVWLTVGLGIALFGLVPRASVLVWIVIAYAAVVANLATLLGLPDWTFNLSPFGHVPQLPADDVRWTPLAILTVIAAGLVAAGLYGFRRRDLETT